MNNDKVKNIEVEIRARLSDADSFKGILKSHGAIFTVSTFIHDIYFCDSSATKVEDVEMDAVGSYSLRLRTTRKNEEKDIVTLNTKTITTQGDHNAWEEHEVEVENFTEVAKMMKIIGFKPFFELEKTRYSYRLGEMDVCVEDIVDFGGAVEVEIMCAKGDENQAKEKIKEFLRQCSLDEKSIVPKSITNIIMKERAFKQNIQV